MARERGDTPAEIPERVFRQSEDYRVLSAARAQRRRRERAEFVARIPVLKLAVVAVPLVALLGWYWIGRFLGLVGGQ